MSQSVREVVTCLFLTMCCLLFAVALTGCASVPEPVTIEVPQSLRARCEGPATEGVQTVGELAAWGIRSEAALQTCEARREAVVAIVDSHRKAVTPRPWWKVW